jgi:hypothetical protein
MADNTPKRSPGDFLPWLGEASRQDGVFASTGQGTMDDITADVPCDGCVKCCSVRIERPIHQTLDPEWLAVESGHGGPVLASILDTGACVYLSPGVGCTIYYRRPVFCRLYDCRWLLATRVCEESLQPCVAQWDISWYQDRQNRVILEALHQAALSMQDRGNSVECWHFAINHFAEFLGSAAKSLTQGASP